MDDRRQAEADPVLNPTPQNMITVSVALRPIIPALETNIATLGRSINQLRPLASDPYKNVILTLDRQRQAAAAVVDAWKAFDTILNTNIEQMNDPTVLATLALKLSVLRERLLMAARFDTVTQDYLDFFKTQMRAALLQDVTDAKPANVAELNRKVLDEMSRIKDAPAATGAERIGAILDAVRQSLAFIPGNHANVDNALSAFGFLLDSQRLLALPSRNAITSELAPSPAPRPASLATTPRPPSAPSEAPAACKGVAPVVTLQICPEAGLTATYSRATADVNFGPISNEVMQVLQAASRGLSVISDPANADRWRLGTAYAKSDGGQGNHNSIIYFENMGRPVVKSSAFDPTKFVVAQGALYRQVFSAAVAAFGAPLLSTAGTAGAPDMQSSNVIATRARIRNAEKAAAAARQKVLDALKTTIDQQKKVKSGNWTTDKAAIIKALQDALQGAASHLEATAGTN
jgi:hypothetical protein